MPVFFRTVAEARVDPLPPPFCLIDQLLYEGEVLLIYGEAKLGKSFSVNSLSWKLANGTDFFGFDIPQPLRVLYLQLENAPAWSEQNTLKIGEAFGYSNDERLILGHGERFGVGEDDNADLLAALERYKPDVFVIDPLYQIHDEDENDGQQVKKVIRMMERDFMAHAKALVIVHHSAKTSQTTMGRPAAQRFSGHNQWGRWAATLMNMSGQSPAKVRVSITGRHLQPEYSRPFDVALNPNTFIFERVENSEGNGPDHFIVNLLAQLGPLSTKEIHEAVGETHGLTLRTVQRLVKELVEEELLEQIHAGRTVQYRPVTAEVTLAA